jgi:hypothetical protein
MLGQAFFIPAAALIEGLRWAWPVALLCLAAAVPAVPSLIALCFHRGAEAPRRLRCSAEGELLLDLAGGVSERVSLLGRSVVVGPWFLLLLQGRRRTRPVLIERASLRPDQAAGLGRVLARLRAGPGSPPPALTSAASALLDPPRRLS